MIQSANDWASPDPTQNIALGDALAFGYALAEGLQIQFAEMYIRTTQNRIISEAELRSNQFIAPLPVNLFTHLVGQASQEINIAQFRAALRNAAQADDPTGTLCQLLSQVLPNTNIPQQFTRIPAIQAVILAALQTL